MPADKDLHIAHVLSQLAVIRGMPEGFSAHLSVHCRMRNASSMSYIEYPGAADEGHLWYVVRGIVRSLNYDHYQDEEHTVHLWRKDDIILNTHSFINRSEREHALQALDDSEFLYLSYPQLRQLINEWPELMTLIYRLGLQRERRLLRHLQWLRYPAADRVRALLLLHPGIDRRVQHSILADYLSLGRSNFNVLLNQNRQAL